MNSLASPYAERLPTLEAPDLPQGAIGKMAVSASEAQIYYHVLSDRAYQAYDSDKAIDYLADAIVMADKVQEGLDWVRGYLGKWFDPDQQAVVDKEFAAEKVPQRFLEWKAESESLAGQTMTWTQWLSRKPERGTPSATDGQLLNVLQWSIHRLKEHRDSSAVREELEENAKRMEHALESAVQHGKLSPALLARCKEHKELPIFVGDLFDGELTTAHGYRDRETGHIVLRSSAYLSTEVHERLHGSKGGFATRLVNEAKTQEYTEVILCQEAEDKGVEYAAPYETYALEKSIMKDVEAIAGLSSLQTSELYAASDDRAANEVRLRQKIEEGAGADLLGYVLDFQTAKEKEILKLETEKAQQNTAQGVPVDKSKLQELAEYRALMITSTETGNMISDILTLVTKGLASSADPREATKAYVRGYIAMRRKYL